jgi:hypothetical protein
MMAVVALALGASSVTARIGRTLLEQARVDAVADAVALAMASGDESLGRAVAISNQVLIIDLEISGESGLGFEALVTVVSERFPGEKYQGIARASTKL